MNDIIERIINTTTMKNLIVSLSEFLENAEICEDKNYGSLLAGKIADRVDSYCKNKTIDNVLIFDETQSTLMLLNTYLCTAEDNREVCEAISELIENCSEFVDNTTTTAISTKTVSEILNTCEESCGAISFIARETEVNVLLLNSINTEESYIIQKDDNKITLSLFALNSDIQPVLYIGNAVGNILYNKLEKQFGKEYIYQEMCRYIPNVRRCPPDSIKKVFGQYFVRTASFKQCKPQIFTHYNDYLKSVIVCNFFRKIIQDGLTKLQNTY